MEPIGIYIHIPFCRRGCFYCHFVKKPYRTDMAERYVKALVRELKLHTNPCYLVDTVYIGGGSPSLLNGRQIIEIMDAVCANFQTTPSMECTFEMNPEDVTRDQLRILKENGFNRLSIGVQSFVPEDLRYLKRTHSVQQSLDAIDNALDNGFTNLNIDFIISLPTQTKESLTKNFSNLQTFSAMKNYEIPHVSAYLLEEVEEGEAREERDHEFYFFTREQLGNLGYDQYEISNFSKPGFRSRHNLKYWKNLPYIGTGLSASGFEHGLDYKNTVKLKVYFDKIDQGVLPKVDVKRQNPSLRRIVMGLRLLEGIPEAYFNDYKEELDFLLDNHMLIRHEGNISVNPEKLLILNEILTHFFKVKPSPQ
ncbi:MAG: radical SAM family heme chaperone HemW [Candidatus Omnitrophota bacterium]